MVINAFDEFVKNGMKLNNEIEKLNEETKAINSIIAEKRNTKKESIINDLRKYIDAMDLLNIDTVKITIDGIMYYNRMNRQLGIEIRRHERGTQIDLGCISDVTNGFYAYHSIGWVISGCNNEKILNEFINCWDKIKNNLDCYFADAFEAILDGRKKETIAEREHAINTLTYINSR